jgi:hypothetical protein
MTLTQGVLDQQGRRFPPQLDLYVDVLEYLLRAMAARDISSAHGSLESLTLYIKRMRPFFFALYNDITASSAGTEPRSASSSSRMNSHYATAPARHSHYSRQPKSYGLAVSRLS